MKRKEEIIKMRMTKKVVEKMMFRHGSTQYPPSKGDIVDFLWKGPEGVYPCNWEYDVCLAIYSKISQAEKNALQWGWVNKYGVLI